MNKEQQIEEISNIITEVAFVQAHEENGDENLSDIVATSIYNAGYRKIDDNCAVITKAELKQYRLQAVREFVKKVKEKALSHCRTINCYELKFIEDTIDELLKEYEKLNKPKRKIKLNS